MGGVGVDVDQDVGQWSGVEADLYTRGGITTLHPAILRPDE